MWREFFREIITWSWLYLRRKGAKVVTKNKNIKINATLAFLVLYARP